MKNKNKKINDLGSFESFADVWRCFPHGGHWGDFIHIGNDIYVWNEYQHNWLLDSWTNTDSYHLLHQTGDLHLMGDLRVGGRTVAQQRAVFKNDVVVEGRLLCRHLQGHDRGFFVNEERLRDVVPFPKVGDWALVGVDSSPKLWQCAQHGIWEMVGDIALENAFNLDKYDDTCDIIDDMLAQGYVFAGVADTTTQPHCPESHRVFYIASQSGRYVNFDNIEVNFCSVLMWNPMNDSPCRGRWTAKSLVGSFWVNNENIADGAVTTEKLADDAVTNDKMACDSVGSCQIQDGAVTLEKTTGLTQYVDQKMKTAIKSISINGGSVYTPNILGHVNLVVGGGGSGDDVDPGLVAQVERNSQDISNLKDGVRELSDGLSDVGRDVDTLKEDVAEVREDLRQTVVMLNWVQSEEPNLLDALSLMVRFPRGLYWLDTSDNTIYELQRGENARFVWVKVESEEALYVDSKNKVLYVQVMNGLNNYDLVQIPASGSGGGDDEGGGEGGGGGDVDPIDPDEPSGDPDILPLPFNYKTGNLGIYKKSVLEKAAEDISVEDVRNACTIGNLYPNATVGGSISDATPHIWTEAEINALGATLDTPLSLVEYDPTDASMTTNGNNNTSLLRETLAHEVNGVKTCIGWKLTKMYYARVNCTVSPSSPNGYKSAVIVLPHDFVIDGDVDGEAVGGFKSYRGLFYTEHSLNLRKVKMLSQGGESQRMLYFNPPTTTAIRQIQIVGCDFDHTEVPVGTDGSFINGGCYIYMRSRSASSSITEGNNNAVPTETNCPIDAQGYAKDANCIDNILIADNTFKGSACVAGEDMRVVKSFRIVGNTFAGINTNAISISTMGNKNSYAQTNCYMSCPVFVAGNTFRGRHELFKPRTWNAGTSIYCCSAVLESSAAYMVHNDIRDFVSGRTIVIDPTSAHSGSETDYMYVVSPATYDAYLNCVQVYYANNTVRNVNSFTYSRISASDVSGSTTLHRNGSSSIDWETPHLNSGIVKAKNVNMTYVKVVNGSIPERPMVRHIRGNTYVQDSAELREMWDAWWNAQDAEENYIHQPSDGAEPGDSWGSDIYFYEKWYDKVINDILTGESASEVAQVLTTVIGTSDLNSSSAFKLGSTTYYLRFKEIDFSNNLVNAGEEGGIVGDQVGYWPAIHVTLCGNTFVGAYITSGAWKQANGWRVRPDGDSSYSKREALFATTLYRGSNADGTADYTSVKIKDNNFTGMGAVGICPYLNFNTSTGLQSWGDHLEWSGNSKPSGSSFVCLHYDGQYSTVDVANYQDYIPAPDPEEAQME